MHNKLTDFCYLITLLKDLFVKSLACQIFTKKPNSLRIFPAPKFYLFCPKSWVVIFESKIC